MQNCILEGNNRKSDFAGVTWLRWGALKIGLTAMQLLLAARQRVLFGSSSPLGVSLFQSLPCVKGGGAVFRDGGIVLSFFFTTYNPSVIFDDSSLYTREPSHKIILRFSFA